jgi:hypothetical protein
MEEARAEEVVAALRERHVFAHLERSGVYEFGIRVVLPDGREAIWDAEGADGLEAVILQDGDLVGYVPSVPESAGLDAAGMVSVIAHAHYDTEDPLAGAEHPPAEQSPERPAAEHPAERPAERPAVEQQPAEPAGERRTAEPAGPASAGAAQPSRRAAAVTASARPEHRPLSRLLRHLAGHE